MDERGLACTVHIVCMYHMYSSSGYGVQSSAEEGPLTPQTQTLPHVAVQMVWHRTPDSCTSHSLQTSHYRRQTKTDFSPSFKQNFHIQVQVQVKIKAIMGFSNY